VLPHHGFGTRLAEHLGQFKNMIESSMKGPLAGVVPCNIIVTTNKFMTFMLRTSNSASGSCAPITVVTCGIGTITFDMGDSFISTLMIEVASMKAASRKQEILQQRCDL
jgi:hypothetical protein